MVNRILRAYSNETERVLWELPILSFSLPAFQVEFGVEDLDDPMVNVYPVKPGNFPFLERYIINPYGWNFDAVAYFVEADAG